MSTVILTKDHRGLGKRGDEYNCNSEVAEKLVRLGRAVFAGADLPAVEPATESEDVEVRGRAIADEAEVAQEHEDEALFTAFADDVTDAVDEDE